MMAGLDSITFEILCHRLEAINLEAALALQRVSGSPLATEAFDMNTSIMTAAGQVVFVGPFLLTGSMSQGMIARYVLAEYEANPGIQPGDMFICNDPYAGAAHQNCVTLVGPIHHAGEIVAWAGATLHEIDVGGSQSGQVGIGARSIFEEAPVIPPLKIVAQDRLLRDVEAEYLRRSRTPDINALDLRGKMAAIATTRQRLADVIAEYGVDALRATLAGAIDDAVLRLRAQLRALPDATFEHTAFLDVQQDSETRFFRVNLRLEKRGEGLSLDFSGSSPQAGAVINCTQSGLRSGALIPVLVYLAQGQQWCPAAIERVVEVTSEPGTVVDASWPAGCSMATMAAGFAVTTATSVCLGKLLAASDAERHKSMAAWAGAVGSVDVFGADRQGVPFGTVLLDSMASGTGARAWADGIDAGGFVRSMGCIVSNVEHYEARFPLLYLFRRQEPDTGGPGRMRGGVGVSYAVMPHGVTSLRTVIPHFSGTEQAESVGLAGGYPGATNQPLVVRGGNISRLLSAGRLPAGMGELDGDVTPLPGVTQISLDADDVFVVVTTGGGGWGDPLEREPSAVEADVRAQLVSRGAAERIYGVVLQLDGSVDAPATSRHRAELLRARQSASHSSQAGPAASRRTSGPLDEGLELLVSVGSTRFRCRSCGHETDELAAASQPMSAAGPHVSPFARGDRFALAERYCPGCWKLLDVERVER